MAPQASWRQRLLQRHRELRLAYTLTELLIVIMIALLLMVISLPVVKTVMDDSRPREASRILNTTLFTAKSRAAATGRLVGVEFTMQAVGDPTATPVTYQCTQMQMCEVPELYSGDTTTAVATIDMDSNSGGTYRLYLQDYRITSDPPTADNTTATAYWLTDQKQLNNDGRMAGAEDVFEIRFDYRGPWYVAQRGTTSNQFFVTIPGNLPVGATSSFNANTYRCAPFQLRRPPVRVGNPVELPRSTCIDTTYSGVGPLGVQFANSDGLRVMFTPEGSVYTYTTVVKDPNSGKVIPVDTYVTGTIHFLVGVVTKINPLKDSSMGPYNFNDVTKSNLADGNALWVSIGRSSGVVTTNENAPDPTLVTDPTDTMQQANYIQNCRRYATAREQKGGR